MEIDVIINIDENGYGHLELPEPLSKRLEGRKVPIVLHIPDEEIVDAEEPSAKSATTNKGEVMRDEYDFSNTERGRFHHPEAQHNMPLYLEDDVLKYFMAKAESKGVDLNTLINDLLKKDIDLIEGVK